jgi:antitoxin component YwqK of YwqJK toxin-antitoxin module
MSGKWTGWYPNGIKNYEGSWLITKSKDAYVEKWSKVYKMNPDSVKSTQISETKVGEWIYYRDTGMIEKKETFSKDGSLNGEVEMYNVAGKLEAKGYYKNGKNHGKWVYYYPFGSILRECEYKEGKLHGKSVMYSERGKVQEECEYLDNKPNGTYCLYDEKTGKVKLKQVYENGRVVKVLEGNPVKK